MTARPHAHITMAWYIVTPGSVKADEHTWDTEESEAEAVRQVVECRKAPSGGKLELRDGPGSRTRENERGASRAELEQHEGGRGAS